MRSQFSNKQKINSIKQILADYINNIKTKDGKLKLDNSFKGEIEYDEFKKTHYKDGKIIIRRQELTIYLSTQYNSINSISTWINKLIGLGILSFNPDSSLSAKKHIYKPTPDSRYFINEEKLFGRDISLSNFG